MASKKAYKKIGKKQTKRKSRTGLTASDRDWLLSEIDDRTKQLVQGQHTVLSELAQVLRTYGLNIQMRSALLDLYNAVRETAKETGQDLEPAKGTPMWNAREVLFGPTGESFEPMAELREENTAGV